MTGTAGLVAIQSRLFTGVSLAIRDPDVNDVRQLAWLDHQVVLGGIDLSRLRQCQRKECDLLFFDMIRSRS